VAVALTRTKRVTNLTPEEYKACYSLNLRNGGLMRGALVSCRENWSESGFPWADKPTYAAMNFNRDGTLAGWVLIFPDEYDNLAAYFYVRRNQRRKGVGSKLAKHVSKKFGQVRVYPHDKRSNGFFNHVHKQKLNVDIQDDYYFEW
jgi:hypothetical protein